MAGRRQREERDGYGPHGPDRHFHFAHENHGARGDVRRSGSGDLIGFAAVEGTPREDFPCLDVRPSLPFLTLSSHAV